MTTAHLFYIPIILLAGVLAGFFLGRRAADESVRERRKKLARRRAIQEKKRAKAGESAPESGENEDSEKPVAHASQ